MHFLKWLERVLMWLVGAVVLQASIMMGITFYGFAMAVISVL
jgi:hypothetical protein